MKRAIIVFVIIFLATSLIPLIQYFKSKESKNTNEMVTLFASVEEATGDSNTALLLPDIR